MPKLNMVKALNLALFQEMERDGDVLVLGEDVGVDGGVFRVTDDLQRKFGSQRVIDSPLAEAAIIGTAVGMALYGLKPVCEIQFSGFAFQCFHQIENHAARYRMRSQGRFHCQMVIRMPYGGGVRALEHHTESEEQFYAHVPGLKMVIPSGPRTARALLTSAIRDPDPVVFFESKALYHAAKEEVPADPEALPIGRAQVVREGRDLTLIAYGAMLRVAREAADVLQAEDRVETEVVDLLTIAPLDRETIVTSVAKTGRAVVVHEAPRSFGPGAEVAASIMEGAFLHLEAPVRRVTANDVSFVGFAREKAHVPDVARVAAAAGDATARARARRRPPHRARHGTRRARDRRRRAGGLRGRPTARGPPHRRRAPRLRAIGRREAPRARRRRATRAAQVRAVGPGRAPAALAPAAHDRRAHDALGNARPLRDALRPSRHHRARRDHPPQRRACAAARPHAHADELPP